MRKSFANNLRNCFIYERLEEAALPGISELETPRENNTRRKPFATDRMKAIMKYRGTSSTIRGHRVTAGPVSEPTVFRKRRAA